MRGVVRQTFRAVALRKTSSGRDWDGRSLWRLVGWFVRKVKPAAEVQCLVLEQNTKPEPTHYNIKLL